jgi:hypothetical protein
MATASQLVDAAHDWRARAQLRSQRDELERPSRSLVPWRELLDKRLAIATDAYSKVKAALDRRRQGVRCADRRRGARYGLRRVHRRLRQPCDGGTLHEASTCRPRRGTPVVAVVDGSWATK